MNYKPRDRFFKEAKKENYLARSVYKLKEIDHRFKLFRSGMKVLDLGCSPGSWSQYSSERVGDRGRVVGIDITEMRISLPNALFFHADINDVARLVADRSLIAIGLKVDSAKVERPGVASEREAVAAAETILQLGQFDLVISDMAPQTTGIKSVDQDRSYALCEMALECAVQLGAPQSHFVCKFFQSGDFAQLRKAIAAKYKRVEIVKPESTRSISKEIFFVGLNKK